MTFLVIAYPELNADDLKLIQHFRREYDHIKYRIIDPHFTLVFPVADINENEFIEEVKKRAANLRKFNFNLRESTLHKDPLSDNFNIFLIPDEGFDDLVKIHEELYCGK